MVDTHKKSSWDGKTRGGFLGYKLFHLVLNFFGVAVAYFVLYFVAFYFLLFGGKATKSSFDYFHSILGLNPFKALVQVYKCYYLYGQTILDKVAIFSNKKHPFTSSSNNAQALGNLAEDNKGGILISAHLGNWEIAGHFLKRYNVPINVVLYDGEHQRIKAMLESVMVEKKFNVIPIKQDFSHILEINRAIKNKEFICIHGDRFPISGKIKELSLKFMGKDASFPLGPFSLISRLKIPYCFVFAIKTGKYHYDLFAFEGKSKSNQIEDIMEAYVAQLEIMVRKYPTQWFNFYPFWNEG